MPPKKAAAKKSPATDVDLAEQPTTKVAVVEDATAAKKTTRAKKTAEEGEVASTPALKKASTTAAKKAANTKSIGVNTITKVSRADPFRQKSGWVLCPSVAESPEHLAKEAAWRAEDQAKRDRTLTTYPARMKHMAWCFQLSPRFKLLAKELKIGLARQVLRLKSGPLRSSWEEEEPVFEGARPSVIPIPAADAKTCDAATDIDYLSMFESELNKAAKDAIAKNPGRHAGLTKPITNYDDSSLTDAQKSDMLAYESDYHFSWVWELKELDPKDRVSFTFADKWRIIQFSETGKTNAEVAKKFGCQPDDVTRWKGKERTMIQQYASNPATADSKRIR